MSSLNVSKCEGALVISCDQLPPENVILQILGKEILPESMCYSNIQGYPWNLETKYYSAEIYLYALKQKEILNSDFSESIRAVVFYVDSTKPSSLDEVKSWIPYLKSIEAEVQLMICNNSIDESDDEGRKNILNWCVQNQFELVELNSTSESGDEEESDIKDVTGYDRVVQSLQSHPWANLVMRDEKNKGKVIEKKENLEEFKEASGSSEVNVSSGTVSANSKLEGSAPESNLKKECKKVNVENEELELEDHWLSNVLNGDDPGGESFEALFSKFASMKDKASNLSGEDRKKYAEKVAIAFWRAMGGDEDEIDGLDDE